VNTQLKLHRGEEENVKLANTEDPKEVMRSWTESASERSGDPRLLLC
jgi:hypothetical protein